jgi:hypothetical protein
LFFYTQYIYIGFLIYNLAAETSTLRFTIYVPSNRDLIDDLRLTIYGLRPEQSGFDLRLTIYDLRLTIDDLRPEQSGFD